MKRFVAQGVMVGALVGASLLIGTLTAAAQDDTAAGNGGTAEGTANGGSVALGTIDSGDAGNAVQVGDSWGDVVVSGAAIANATDAAIANATDAAIANATDAAIAVDGGPGIADASGGDCNLATISASND